MGRFYKTSDPKYLDFMYQLPRKEMLKGIEMTDARIKQQDDANEGLRSLLKLDAIQNNIDDVAADRILKGYEDEIDSISREIQENPLEFRRKSSKITGLQRRIKEDFTRGDAARIQAQYDTRKKNYAAMQEAQLKNPKLYNYDDVEKLQDLLDQRYNARGGFERGNYRPDRLREFVDINDFDKFGKGWQSDIVERLGAYVDKDGLLKTTKNRQEFVRPQDIQKAIKEMIDNDDKLNAYYDQQVDLENISREDVERIKNETARNIGEKYGFLKSSRGITSIKRDPNNTAAYVESLRSPAVNIVPGTINDVNLIDNYNSSRQTPVKSNTDGYTQIIGDIDTKQRDLASQALKLASINKIDLNKEQLEALKAGEFASLKGIQGTDGETISGAVLLGLQEQYDKLDYDRQILTKKLNKAKEANPTNPDAWLEEHDSKPATINNTSTFQTSEFLVNKNAKTDYDKNIKAWREELHNTKSWWDAQLQVDQNAFQKLPKATREKLEQYMENNGGTFSMFDITTDELETGILKRDTEAKRRNVPSPDLVIGDLRVPQEDRQVTDYLPTSEWSNLKVNAEYAKPAVQLDGEGNVIAQFEIEIDGYPIQVYMPETELSNSNIKKHMNLEAMEIASIYRKALNEGAIDEEGFVIDGVNFHKVGGKNKAHWRGLGSREIEESISDMAKERKARKMQLLKD